MPAGAPRHRSTLLPNPCPYVVLNWPPKITHSPRQHVSNMLAVKDTLQRCSRSTTIAEALMDHHRHTYWSHPQQEQDLEQDSHSFC